MVSLSTLYDDIVTLIAQNFSKTNHTHSDMQSTSNISQSISTDASSTTKYPSVKAVKDYTDDLIGNAISYINQ